MPTEETTAAPQPEVQPPGPEAQQPELPPVYQPEEELPDGAPSAPTGPATPPAELIPPTPRAKPIVPAETIPPSTAPTANDERQTLADLFRTLPLGARVGIVVVLAILLTLAVLATFWPSPKQADANDAAATVMAGNLTLTAQPTPTAIGTETPRMYIIEESPVPTLTPDVTSTPIVYVVKQGDTLNSIARLYNVTIQDIATANGLFNVNTIAVGQELMIPTPGAGTAVPPSAPGAPIVQTTPPDNTPLLSLPEIVIKGTSGAQTVELRIAAGPDYQSITTLTRGMIASLVAKTPDNLWYLIQLEDGYTRGWVPANSVGLIYPADPANIPTTPVP